MSIKRFLEGVQELRALWLGKRARRAATGGDLQTAERINRKALAIMERALGEVEQTVIYVFNLADVLAAQGKFAEAAEGYRRALEMDEADLGPSHPRRTGRYLVIVPRLVAVLRELGRENEADQIEREAEAFASRLSDS